MMRFAVPPEATKAISYRIPTFRHKGALVGFAAFPNHGSFSPMNSSVLERFENDLQGLETSKGAIRFPLHKPLSAALVKKVLKPRSRRTNSRNSAPAGCLRDYLVPFMPNRMAGQFRSVFLDCRPAGKGQTITAHCGPEAHTAHGIMRTT